ncbi:adenylate/guanylate cyclase domain-containing protein [Allorhizobium pseudoryzae]|jgi:adenylate cyclase|uniref:adenylate/guanylate cyclase domain-containing protein n=1 Tax=Allorhizobium pseudoryzae TaxID=379684 RepID=UPI003CFFF14A
MPKILIVDDEDENLQLLKIYLLDNNSDWHVFAVQSVDEGLSVLKAELATGEPIDLLLTDLVMDSDDAGMKLMREARLIDPLLMAILFTAKEQSLDRYGALEYGVFDVVEKNIRGSSAAKEINLKARSALKYRSWSSKVSFLQKYFDPKLFSAIEQKPDLLDMASRNVTIAFWDIRGFSKFCDSMKAHPKIIGEFLREYCEIAAGAVFNHNGILDKFIGDGVMAIFGALESAAPDDSCGIEEAIEAARQFRSEFHGLTRRWADVWGRYVPDQIEIGLGCGLHTGEALVGNVGTRLRDQFTALGPHVNFAARLESRAKSGDILLSQTAAIRARTKYLLNEVDEISDIKNIPGTFKIFSVGN